MKKSNKIPIINTPDSCKLLVASFYKFISIDDCKKLKDKLENFCLNTNVLGTILIAPEGINGTISGDKKSVDSVLSFLWADKRFIDLTPKFSFSKKRNFIRMKVKLKKEIVTMGIKNIKPQESTAEFVSASNWNNILSDPDIVLLDTRNEYETSIGSFKGAIFPETKSFRDFPEWANANLSNYKNKKIAMFCTGGIRCEKASSFLKKAGFLRIYQLEGGILKYIEEVDESKSVWEGSCFVFDDRVALNHGLQESTYEMCHACRMPYHPDETTSKYFIEGVSCSKCYNVSSSDRKKRFAERQKQIELAKTRKEEHLGKKVIPVKK